MPFTAAYEKLTELSRELIRGCRKEAFDGTVLFTPDAVGNYNALWVRDFGYMVEYAGDLMDPDEIRRCIEYVLARQRCDGWLADRAELGGDAEFAAGAKGHPIGKANLDNGPFLVFSVYFYFALIGREEAGAYFNKWYPALRAGIDCIPTGPEGLVYNDAAAPHSPYGFTDIVCKTGNLFMESVLYWRALRQLEQLCESFGADAALWADRARAVENALCILRREEDGSFYAADGLCRQPDVWGMLYALEVDFPFAPQVRRELENWLLVNRHRYLQKGQVCHLPDGGAWEKLLIEVPHGEYQNGAYWATASGWALRLFRRLDPEFALQMLEALLADFAEGTPCECVNGSYRKLPHFVVSAVNARGGLGKKIPGHLAF